MIRLNVVRAQVAPAVLEGLSRQVQGPGTTVRHHSSRVDPRQQREERQEEGVGVGLDPREERWGALLRGDGRFHGAPCEVEQVAGLEGREQHGAAFGEPRDELRGQSGPGVGVPHLTRAASAGQDLEDHPG